MTSYLNENEVKNLQNAPIPDFGMGHLENHLAHLRSGMAHLCIFHALSFELNSFIDRISL